ncbi:hypothetical protein AB1Y20_007413 [Prymnesium parvum]|uniref:Uncharacterized protein n=1 Tax=Prymnesium parvum TaxID=97485 RepID=A0AB34IXE8_PRYPA
MGVHTFLRVPPGDGIMLLVAYYCVVIGFLGTIFNFVINQWIRGESISLRQALEVDRIDKKVEGWDDMSDGEGENHREYAQVYEAGAARGLGALAALDWETNHLQFEKQMGLFDLSDHVFDAPEHDPGMLSAFLNSSLLSAFQLRGADAKRKAEKAQSLSEMAPITVEVPTPMTSMLRDALLQHRLRHGGHPLELDTVNGVLGQLDKSFSPLAVAVPEQVRPLLVEALIAFAHNHPDLQLDACFAVRLLTTLQHLSPSFQPMELELPQLDENKPSNDSSAARKMLSDVILHRLNESKREISMEEGMILQQTLHQLDEAFSLIPMDHADRDVEEMQLLTFWS